jgi:hypothetical protein
VSILNFVMDKCTANFDLKNVLSVSSDLNRNLNMHTCNKCNRGVVGRQSLEPCMLTMNRLF